MSQKQSRRPVEAIASRNLRSAECEARVRKAVAKLSKTGLPFTIEDVCLRAAVGKTFIYDKKHLELTQLVIKARDTSQLNTAKQAEEADASQVISWRTRAFNAEARVKQLRDQVSSQDARISDLTGQLFDPEGNHLADENARLRDQLDMLNRELTKLRSDYTISQRSLQAARSTVKREQERSLALVDLPTPR